MKDNSNEMEDDDCNLSDLEFWDCGDNEAVSTPTRKGNRLASRSTSFAVSPEKPPLTGKEISLPIIESLLSSAESPDFEEEKGDIDSEDEDASNYADDFEDLRRNCLEEVEEENESEDDEADNISISIEKKEEEEDDDDDEESDTESSHEVKETNSEIRGDPSPSDMQDSPKIEDSNSTDRFTKGSGSGRKMLTAKEGDRSIEEFSRAIALARIVHSDQHWRYYRCKVFLAQSYLYVKEYAIQADTQAREAVEGIKISFGTTMAPSNKPQVQHVLLWGYLIMGESKMKQGQMTSVQRLLLKALQHFRTYNKMISRKKKLIPSLKMDRPSDLLLKILRSQAAFFERTANYEKAKEKLEEGILVIESEERSVEDPRLPGPLQQLGELLLNHPGSSEKGAEEDDIEKGIDCLTRALSITQAANRPGSVAECEARATLLQYQLKLNRIEATDSLRELYKLKTHFSRLYGSLNTKTLAIHNLTVQVLVQEENYSDAIELLRSHWKLCKSVYGDYSNQVCSVLRQLSRVHFLNEDYKGAANALDQCLTAESLLHGFSSRRAEASRIRLREVLQ